MRSVGQIALVMFVIAALLPAAQAAAQSRGNSAIAHEAHKKDKKDKENKAQRSDTGHATDAGAAAEVVYGNGPISVPEPATIVLLGAAAGVFGVRRIWQRQRRMGASVTD